MREIYNELCITKHLTFARIFVSRAVYSQLAERLRHIFYAFYFLPHFTLVDTKTNMKSLTQKHLGRFARATRRVQHTLYTYTVHAVAEC